jgi:hypothetical protein
MAVRKRSLYSLIAAGVLVLIAGLAVGLITAFSGSNSSQRGSTSAIEFNTAQQIRLERGLTESEIGSQATIVAPEIRSQFMGRGQLLLPAGSQVRIEPATFQVTPSGIATVNAVITGSEPGRWQLLLVRDDGNWALIGTRRLP